MVCEAEDATKFSEHPKVCGSVWFRLCKVQYLDLSMSETSTAALEQVVSACVMLRKLSLANCIINENVCR